MTEIFDSFPKVMYNKKELTYILSRVIGIKQKIKYFDVYYPYTIKDGERADTIASDYYDSSEFAWLIYLVNDITDPYYDFPLTNKQFFKYLDVKYGDYFATKTTIAHYKYEGVDGDNIYDIEDKGYFMTPYTFDNMTTAERAGWVPVYQFDYENELNESKREIKLLSNRFISQIKTELREMFN